MNILEFCWVFTPNALGTHKLSSYRTYRFFPRLYKVTSFRIVQYVDSRGRGRVRSLSSLPLVRLFVHRGPNRLPRYKSSGLWCSGVKAFNFLKGADGEPRSPGSDMYWPCIELVGRLLFTLYSVLSLATLGQYECRNHPQFAHRRATVTLASKVFLEWSNSSRCTTPATILFDPPRWLDTRPRTARP